MLSQLRLGSVSPDVSRCLAERHAVYRERAADRDDMSLEVTHIFPQTKQVRRHNSRCLVKMESITGYMPNVHEAVDTATDVELDGLALQGVLDKAFLAPLVLELCVGSRVAKCGPSLKYKGVFNGTKGVVIGFEADEGDNETADVSCLVLPKVLFLSVNGGKTVDVIAGREVMTIESVVTDVRLHNVCSCHCSWFGR